MGTGSWKPALFNISKCFELLSHLPTKTVILKADENEMLWKWTRWGRTGIIFQESSSSPDKWTSLLISAERSLFRELVIQVSKNQKHNGNRQIQTHPLQKMDFICITWKIDRKQEVDKIIKRNLACISGHRWYLPDPCRFWSSIWGSTGSERARSCL